MGLSLMGCFPGDFQEGNGPLRHSRKRPVKVRKWPIKEGKRPFKAKKAQSEAYDNLNLKIILTTPTPHISKKYDPKICHK